MRSLWPKYIGTNDVVAAFNEAQLDVRQLDQYQLQRQQWQQQRHHHHSQTTKPSQRKRLQSPSFNLPGVQEEDENDYFVSGDEGGQEYAQRMRNVEEFMLQRLRRNYPRNYQQQAEEIELKNKESRTYGRSQYHHSNATTSTSELPMRSSYRQQTLSNYNEDIEEYRDDNEDNIEYSNAYPSILDNVDTFVIDSKITSSTTTTTLTIGGCGGLGAECANCRNIKIVLRLSLRYFYDINCEFLKGFF